MICESCGDEYEALNDTPGGALCDDCSDGMGFAKCDGCGEWGNLSGGYCFHCSSDERETYREAAFCSRYLTEL